MDGKNRPVLPINVLERESPDYTNAFMDSDGRNGCFDLPNIMMDTAMAFCNASIKLAEKSSFSTNSICIHVNAKVVAK